MNKPMLRVVPIGFDDESSRQGDFISPHGSRSYNLPGLRVTLDYRDTSDSGIAFCHLRIEEIRQGLCRFSRPEVPA